MIGAYFLTRQFARLARLRAGIGGLARDALVLQTEMAAQNGLEQNLDMLRGALFALGAPRLEGDVLYYGKTRINGDHAIVDQVKAKFGGAATVFMRDTRIATNVQRADGGRAVGTRLDPGKAHDRVLREGLSYRGEATILGEPYLAYYEPILSGDSVIGMLFAGVRKSEAGAIAATAPAIETSIGNIRGIMERQAADAAQALLLRQAHQDAQRRIAAAQQTRAVQQGIAVAELAGALDRLSNFDLSFQLGQVLSADYEPLRQNFNKAIAQLRQTMQAAVRNTGDVGNGAAEIRHASEDLARRTEHQAATLEQTAASLDQITATVSKTAAGASTARAAMQSTAAEAKASNVVLQETVAAMAEIEAQSTQIANIIGVIDEIAFQTNLLALNAGVEAARAGDAGRGFAVVASEVRALAQRSADAAKSIKALISSSGQKVDQGVRLVNGTVAALERIVVQVDRLNLLVSEISTAAQEQASGLAQVNVAINQIDQVTQQNAAMVEQTTAASTQLAREAEDLNVLLRRFATEPGAARTNNVLRMVAGER